MCVCIQVCIHVCMYLCMCACMYVYVYVCVCIYMCVCVCVYMCMCAVCSPTHSQHVVKRWDITKYPGYPLILHTPVTCVLDQRLLRTQSNKKSSLTTLSHAQVTNHCFFQGYLRQQICNMKLLCQFLFKFTLY